MSKTYRVVFADTALDDLRETVVWISQHSRRNAQLWLQRVRAKASTLDHNPQRCPIAPDDDAFRGTVRQMLYGRRPNVYRILYDIRERSRTVRILRVMHAARRFLNEPGDTDD